MRMYLSGPMRGFTDYNRPAFTHAAAYLRACGHEVVNPLELDGVLPASAQPADLGIEFMRKVMARDMVEIAKCAAVAMLPGWRDSAGATAEYHMAKAIGLQVYLLDKDNEGLRPEQYDAPAGGVDTILVNRADMRALEDEAASRTTDGGFITKDSGQRETFVTGSQRDTGKGKGRYDLLPPVAIERLAKLYERGANKYDARNWEKGQSLARFMESLLRHAFKHLEGHRDEDHMAAVMWNAAGLIHCEEMIRRGILPAELNDLPDYVARSAHEKSPAVADRA